MFKERDTHQVFFIALFIAKIAVFCVLYIIPTTISKTIISNALSILYRVYDWGTRTNNVYKKWGLATMKQFYSKLILITLFYSFTLSID